ncbi:MAG: HEAT repeat domain-containing protein [Pyrinomonadaceae bacterium MAG19_C2-C3]|nr:HEAT repeat domain-containing protein [Pyrinomonadaceae bacterium MAG19_C2-C3]
MSQTSENKTRSPLSIVVASHKPRFGLRLKGKDFPFAVRAALVALCVASLAILASIVPHAQRGKETGVRVTGVSSRQTAQGSVYTLAADAPVARPQTWHDAEGLHVVIYKGQSMNASAPRGVTQRRVGDSLELVFPVREAGNAAVRQQGNNLEVVVNETASRETAQPAREMNTKNTRTASRPAASKRGASIGSPLLNSSEEIPTLNLDASQTQVGARAPGVTRFKSGGKSKTAKVPQASGNEGGKPFTASSQFAAPSQNELAFASPSTVSPASSLPASSSPSSGEATPASSPLVVVENPETASNLTPSADVNTASATNTEANAEKGEEQGDYLLWGLFGVAVSLVGAFVFVRRQRSDDASVSSASNPDQAAKTSKAEAKRQAASEKDKRKGNDRRKGSDKLAPAAPVNNELDSEANQASSGLVKAGMRMVAAPAAAPLVMYGAYQIDQEINKLMNGEPHRLDVLNSRAPDDRRALEISLMKQLRFVGGDEAKRRKVRTTLEEYGFVARLSASLLLAPESCDRIASARSLGEIGSSAAFPFLLEALYDRDNAVRVEAVAGLGTLGVPAAIGALLDVARRHADIPSNLLSDALARCSVPALNFDFEIGDKQSSSLLTGYGDVWTGEITTLEPTGKVQLLPEWLDDEIFGNVMQRLETTDPEVRAAAARELAQFKAEASVAALSLMAAHDGSAAVRAAAVSSLGTIDHESVFVPVLLCLIDDAREVRAAAARSISRFGFDRADAYVRVIENADVETLRQIARALIEAGFAAQAVSRLGSEDRRQGYEAFSLLSVVVKGGEFQIIIDAIATHEETTVRLALVRFLRISCDERALAALSKIADNAALPAGVRKAILEINFNEAVGGQAHAEIVEDSQPTASDDFDTTSIVMENNVGSDRNTARIA